MPRDVLELAGVIAAGVVAAGGAAAGFGLDAALLLRMPVPWWWAAARERFLQLLSAPSSAASRTRPARCPSLDWPYRRWAARPRGYPPARLDGLDAAASIDMAQRTTGAAGFAGDETARLALKPTHHSLPQPLRKEADPPRRLRKRPTYDSPVMLMVGRNCTAVVTNN